MYYESQGPLLGHSWITHTRVSEGPVTFISFQNLTILFNVMVVSTAWLCCLPVLAAVVIAIVVSFPFFIRIQLVASVATFLPGQFLEQWWYYPLFAIAGDESLLLHPLHDHNLLLKFARHKPCELLQQLDHQRIYSNKMEVAVCFQHSGNNEGFPSSGTRACYAVWDSYSNFLVQITVAK